MRKIRMGMIGGANDAFIGAVHRMAANLDGQIELVCGCFSSSFNKTRATGLELGLPNDRLYRTAEEMFASEQKLSEESRMEFVAIVTPNFLHFDTAYHAIKNNFHVVCEKPITMTSEEAKKLEQIVKEKNRFFCLMHNYTGYPMVKEARQMIAQGKLGKIRKVIAEYPQGWLSTNIETDGQKQAGWRTDPDKAGISCCVGDIGSHAENLTEYITGLNISSLAADVSTFVEGRLLDDDANILLRFNNGAKGIITVSQIAAGEENELRIRVYGEKGGLEWLQSEPNTLIFKTEETKQIIRTGKGKLSTEASNHTRLPAGHPEGYLEAMANLYRNFATAIREDKVDPELDFPTVKDGVRGIKFIEKVIASSERDAAWVEL